MPRLVVTTVRLSHELHGYAKEAADASGIGLAAFIRECVVLRLAFMTALPLDVDDERWVRLRSVADEIAALRDHH